MLETARVPVRSAVPVRAVASRVALPLAAGTGLDFFSIDPWIDLIRCTSVGCNAFGVLLHFRVCPEPVDPTRPVKSVI